MLKINLNQELFPNEKSELEMLDKLALVAHDIFSQHQIFNLVLLSKGADLNPLFYFTC